MKNHAKLSQILICASMVLIFSISSLAAQSPVFGSTEGSGQENAAVRRFGLFIGTNDGGSQRQQLLWAVSDANKLYSVLSDVGGIAEGDGLVLENPGENTVENGFARISRYMDDARESARRVEFVFYYSGHSDETGLLLGDDHISYTDLRDLIEAVNADVSIAILDSCASGAFVRGKGGQRTTPFLADDASEMSGHAYITSSSADELAQESDRIEASFFTHYMISALRGAADHSGDRRVTLNEAYEYAFNETLSVTSSTLSGPQHASYNIQLSGTGDLVLTDISNPVSSVIFDANLSGRVYIKDGRGGIVAEINKAYGEITELALDPGIYTVELVNEENQYSRYRFNLSFRSTNVIDSQVMAAYSPQANRSRGGEATEPFLDSQGNVSEEDDFFSVDEDFFDTEEDFFSNVPSLPAGSQEQTSENLKTQGTSELPSSKTPEFSRVPMQEEVEYTYLPLYVQLVPGMSYPFVAANISATVAASPLILEVGQIEGVGASGIMTLTSGNVTGAALSGVFSSLDGDLYGVAASSVFNVLQGHGEGAQIAGVFNVAEESSALAQIAGVFNVAEEPLQGVQVAGVFNTADNRIDGVQIAGVFNATTGVNGAQVAGVVNTADRVNGAQIGLLNLTDDVNGFQTGLFNLARGTVHGFQLGLINISDDMYGVPLGLFSWVNQGIHDISGWNEDELGDFVGILNGSRNFYTTLYAGANIDNLTGIMTDSLDNLTLGFGWGLRLHEGPFYSDVEVSVRRGTMGSNPSDRLASAVDVFNNPYVYPSAKVTFGIDIFGIGLYFGYSADLELDTSLTGGVTHYNGFGGAADTIEGFGTIHRRVVLGIKL